MTLYLEWGNNSWHAAHKPVTSKNDYSTYFVVNTWSGAPEVTLVRRNSEDAVELATFTLPDALAAEFMAKNPFPLVYPCHRVVGTSGALTGFGPGLDMKKYLLELEGAG